MANSIKIGNNDITFKVGSTDVDAIYLGSTLMYSGGTPPTPVFEGKYKLTLSDSSTVSAECDSTSAVTYEEVSSQYSGTLVSAEIGDCVTSIGVNAFSGCTSLTSVTIPNSVTRIGESSFERCTSLTSCTIGSGITSIGEGAFYGCESLTSVTVNAITPPTLSYYSFGGTSCPIYVPSQSVNAYKTATNWSEYADRIQAIP